MKDIKEKIKKLAEMLGEPIWRIEESLGLKDDNKYSSLSEKDLKIIFRDSSSYSEDEYFIQKELERRLEIEINSGLFSRVRDAYFLAVELELEKSKLKAFQVWDELSCREVDKASTYEEIKIACERSPKAGRARIWAHEKKEVILESLFNQATSIDDYIKIFKIAPLSSLTRRKVAQKLLSLVL